MDFVFVVVVVKRVTRYEMVQTRKPSIEKQQYYYYYYYYFYLKLF